MVLTLTQNSPNPFNPRTTIEFSLTRAGQVRLSVFDLQGRLVHETRAAGRHTVAWNGTDDRGQAVPAGTYLYRLDTGERVLSRTMVLVK